MKKVITVLKALEKGVPVYIKEFGESLVLSGDNDICIKCSDVLVRVNMGISFKEFYNMCEGLSDDEIFTINANIALNTK